MPLRASDPPKKPAARRPAAPKARVSGPASTSRGESEQRAGRPERGHRRWRRPRQSRRRGSPRSVRSREAPAAAARDRRGSRQAAREMTLSHRFDRTRAQGRRWRHARRFGGGPERGEEGRPDTDRGREQRRRGVSGSRDLCGRQIDVRDGAGDSAQTQRAPGTRRPLRPRIVPATPIAEALGHEDREDRGARCPERPQRRDLRTSPQDRYRNGVGDQEDADQERQGAQRIQVEAKRADHSVCGRRGLPRRLEREPLRKTRANLFRRLLPRDSRLENDVHAVDEPRPSQKLLRGEDVGRQKVSSRRPRDSGELEQTRDRDRVAHAARDDREIGLPPRVDDDGRTPRRRRPSPGADRPGR